MNGIDEVFADYPLEGATAWAEAPGRCLTATISGLSKVAALPQLKLSWGVLSGPEHDVAEAHPELVELYSGVLDARFGKERRCLQESAGEVESPEIDPEMLERLEALGYVEVGGR